MKKIAEVVIEDMTKEKNQYFEGKLDSHYYQIALNVISETSYEEASDMTHILSADIEVTEYSLSKDEKVWKKPNKEKLQNFINDLYHKKNIWTGRNPHYS